MKYSLGKILVNFRNVKPIFTEWGVCLRQESVEVVDIRGVVQVSLSCYYTFPDRSLVLSRLRTVERKGNREETH